MHFITTLAVLLSVGASAVIGGGQVAAPAMPVAPRAVSLRQTSRDQVVRRMTHGMRRMNKRQNVPSALASRCGGPSSFVLQISGLTGDAAGYNNQYLAFTPYQESDSTFNVVPAASTSDATTFAMTDSCAFSTASRDFVADIADPNAAALFFDTPGTINENGYTTSTCKVVGESFTCSFGTTTDTWAICPNGDAPWFIATYGGDNLPLGCENVSLNAMSA